MREIFSKFAFGILLVFGSGCASMHEDQSEHHHHPQAQYEGKCAYSVLNNKTDVEGKPDYKLDHRGVSYYFSSQENLNKFKDHADANIQRANRIWDSRGKN